MSSTFLAAASLIDDIPDVDSGAVSSPVAPPPPPRISAAAPASRTSRANRPPAPARAAAPGYLVAGAHGGAGVSTVAALLGLGLEPGVAAEVGAPPGLLAGRRRALVVVARANAYGLMRASERLPSVAHHRPVLVLVADAPAADPTAVRFRVRALEPLVAGVARVPFLPWLRAVDHPSELADFPKLRRAAEALRQQLSRITPVEGA